MGTLGRAGCSVHLRAMQANSQSSQRALASALARSSEPCSACASAPCPESGASSAPRQAAGLLSQSEAPLGVSLAKPDRCRQGKGSTESLLHGRPRGAQVAQQKAWQARRKQPPSPQNAFQKNEERHWENKTPTSRTARNVLPVPFSLFKKSV